MTPEQQRIAIAQACGWRDLQVVNIHAGNSPLFGTHIASDGVLARDQVPDYLNDLNAMHEAEKLLTNYDESTRVSQYGSYIDTLQQITNWNRVPCATAAQRAEAFLRTLNLWKP